MSDRIILHLDMDCFFAAVEEREDPSLRGKPVVVGALPEGGRGRGVVSTSNYVARKFGIKSAMPISAAYRACSDAIFLPVRMELYAKVSNRIMEIIRSLSGSMLMEQVSVDEMYLDCTSLGSFDTAKMFGETLRTAIFNQEKLTASVGIGSSKLIAKIASDAKKPNGCFVVLPGVTEDFLALLPVRMLPGVGEKTETVLHGLGIKTITDLRNTPEETVVARCGNFGERLLELAYGIDPREVVAQRVIKSIGRSTTFRKDTRDKTIIMEKFLELCNEVYRELISNEFKFKTITVVYRYSNFEIHDRSHSLQKPTNEWSSMKSAALQLFVPAFLETRRTFRLIGVRVSHFTSNVRPIAIIGLRSRRKSSTV